MIDTHMCEQTPYELALDALSADDEIVFVTDRSTYRFVVEDPSAGRGHLRGGAVADGRTAFLCGAVDRPHSLRPATLLAGARALFLVEEAADRSSYRRVLTSNLVDVRVVRPD